MEQIRDDKKIKNIQEDWAREATTHGFGDMDFETVKMSLGLEEDDAALASMKNLENESLFDLGTVFGKAQQMTVLAEAVKRDTNEEKTDTEEKAEETEEETEEEEKLEG